MERERVWSAIEAERHALAGLLESLSPEQWETPSLCAGWRVREVAAHVTLVARIRPLGAAAGFLRARGSFDRFVADDARARARRDPAELVAELRRLAASRHHPPGMRCEDPLVDVLVHTQDVARPLGLDHDPPRDALVAAAGRVWGMGFPFRARRRAAGVRLVAADAPWSGGEGEDATGRLVDILLFLTGRHGALERLEGRGAAVLAAATGRPS